MESVNDMGDDFSTFPIAGGINMIYMIGCLSVNYTTQTEIYESFVADKMDHSSERKMIDKWIKSMEIATDGFTKKLFIYHWCRAEKNLMNQFFKNHNIDRNSAPYNKIIMIDMCQAFRDAFVAIPNVFSYSIKDISRELYK